MRSTRSTYSSDNWYHRSDCRNGRSSGEGRYDPRRRPGGRSVAGSRRLKSGAYHPRRSAVAARPTLLSTNPQMRDVIRGSMYWKPSEDEAVNCGADLNGVPVYQFQPILKLSKSEDHSVAHHPSTARSSRSRRREASPSGPSRRRSRRRSHSTSPSPSSHGSSSSSLSRKHRRSDLCVTHSSSAADVLRHKRVKSQKVEQIALSPVSDPATKRMPVASFLSPSDASVYSTVRTTTMINGSPKAVRPLTSYATQPTPTSLDRLEGVDRPISTPSPSSSAHLAAYMTSATRNVPPRDLINPTTPPQCYATSLINDTASPLAVTHRAPPLSSNTIPRAPVHYSPYPQSNLNGYSTVTTALLSPPSGSSVPQTRHFISSPTSANYSGDTLKQPHASPRFTLSSAASQQERTIQVAPLFSHAPTVKVAGGGSCVQSDCWFSNADYMLRCPGSSLTGGRGAVAYSGVRSLTPRSYEPVNHQPHIKAPQSTTNQPTTASDKPAVVEGRVVDAHREIKESMHHKSPQALDSSRCDSIRSGPKVVEVASTGSASPLTGRGSVVIPESRQRRDGSRWLCCSRALDTGSILDDSSSMNGGGDKHLSPGGDLRPLYTDEDDGMNYMDPVLLIDSTLTPPAFETVHDDSENTVLSSMTLGSRWMPYNGSNPQHAVNSSSYQQHRYQKLNHYEGTVPGYSGDTKRGPLQGGVMLKSRPIVSPDFITGLDQLGNVVSW
eukprot:GHVH01006098.1.p1 GENE.GHVH01006098.1~~GHVH01006098.1.p1  ORF type:complete len:723 (+),score=67.04 GHVH01006098.1:1004-3172(+)